MESNLESERREIGDFTYDIWPVDGEVASIMITRLGRKLLPALGALKGALGEGNEAAAGTVILDALTHAASLLEPEEMVFFRDHFAKKTRVHRKDGSAPFLKDVFKDHFSRRPMDMVKWMGACFEVNFGPFFDGLRPFLAKIAASMQGAPGQKESSSDSPPTSTGASGGSSLPTS